MDESDAIDSEPVLVPPSFRLARRRLRLLLRWLALWGLGLAVGYLALREFYPAMAALIHPTEAQLLRMLVVGGAFLLAYGLLLFAMLLLMLPFSPFNYLEIGVAGVVYQSLFSRREMAWSEINGFRMQERKTTYYTRTMRLPTWRYFVVALRAPEWNRGNAFLQFDAEVFTPLSGDREEVARTLADWLGRLLEQANGDALRTPCPVPTEFLDLVIPLSPQPAPPPRPAAKPMGRRRAEPEPDPAAQAAAAEDFRRRVSEQGYDGMTDQEKADHWGGYVMGAVKAGVELPDGAEASYKWQYYQKLAKKRRRNKGGAASKAAQPGQGAGANARLEPEKKQKTEPAPKPPPTVERS